jgi:acyl-CoA thioesterase II
VTAGASQPCPFEARARIDGDQVAASSAAVVVEPPDGTPVLYFPAGDVAEGVTERSDVRLLADAPGGYVGFDPSDPRLRLEVIDAVAGGDERDASVKRFPVWGDATHLFDMLDVRPDGEAGFVTVPRAHHGRSVVEGSQLLAQSIVAAGRHAPGRRVVVATMAFIRAADGTHPLRIDLEELNAGRNFTTLVVHVSQGGRRCASGMLFLGVPAADAISHSAEAPAVAGPYDSEPFDMGVTGRDIRVVDGAYTGDPDAPLGPPELDAWVRFRAVPDDPSIHAGLLAHFTGHMSIAAAMRPHPGVGQDQAHVTLSTAINAITISFHQDVHADRWMLYHHLSTYAGDGMTHAECRVFDADGGLVASFTVEAMVRPFATDAPRDPKSAL